MNDKSIMPFGIHKGKRMANVPAPYLIWLFDNDKCHGELWLYILDNKDDLKEEIKRQ